MGKWEQIFSRRVACATAVAAGMLANTVGLIAASSSASLGVTASVANNCTISTLPLAFGSYDPVVANASTALDGTGTVTIACTKGATTTIGLGLGSNASGSTRRRTDGPGTYLTYAGRQDRSHSTVWGTSDSGFYTTTADTSQPGRNLT